MSFLEKIGLVERDVITQPTVEAEFFPIEPDVMVDAQIESVENIVDEIYGQNELSDKSNSIYTVQALIDTLPAEMTTAKKQATVAGILTVSGKTITALLEDAEKRLGVLAAAQSKILAEQTAEIDTANADIEALKCAIEAANIKIKESEDIIAATKKAVEDETSAISELVDFCNGMEDK